VTVALTDGPLGLEATHVWTPGDGGAPIVLNDLTDKYGIRFDSMPGFRSLPEADNNAFPRTARMGETPLPSLVRGKTFTVNGRLRAQTMRLLRQMEWSMAAAFGERSLLGTWAAVPNPDYGDDTVFWQTNGRVLQYDPDEALAAAKTALPSPYQTPFLLGIRQTDPRWVWSDPVASPTNSGMVTVTNEGNAPAELVATVAGASGTTTVFNDTITAQLKFVGLPSGTLVIDSGARTALIGTDDALPFMDTLLSNWWDRGTPGLQPLVANTIRQTGGSSIQVGFHHTAW
jgi:hypothetical protein